MPVSQASPVLALFADAVRVYVSPLVSRGCSTETASTTEIGLLLLKGAVNPVQLSSTVLLELVRLKLKRRELPGMPITQIGTRMSVRLAVPPATNGVLWLIGPPNPDPIIPLPFGIYVVEAKLSQMMSAFACGAREARIKGTRRAIVLCTAALL
jgi:hypothetical protein